MGRCFYFLLVLCLGVPELSYSKVNEEFIAADCPCSGDSPSTAEQLESQRDTEGHLILSRFLSNPNVRVAADGKESASCEHDTGYRTYDGTCTNLQHPTLGSVESVVLRLLPSFYEGKSGMRRAVNGDPLPEPRDLTLNIFTTKDDPAPNVTLFFTAFGQILSHDQAFTTPPVGPVDLVNDLHIHCCPMSKADNPNCDSIRIREDDPFYSKFNITCMDYLRGHHCLSGNGQICNRVTSAVDANMIYGLHADSAEKLRTRDGTGRLKGRYTENGEQLPVRNGSILVFCPVAEPNNCFETGDLRGNQNTYVVAFHTILHREHNRMVKELKFINPDWDDETLYQTGRKILGAKLQAMVYNEYAPLLLGRKYMNEFKLWVTDEGESTQYDPSLRFGTFVEYTTGIFRAHSMIPTKTGYGSNRFRDLYSNNHPVIDGEMAQVIRGSCKVSSQMYGRYQVPDVFNYLYKQPHDDYGIDLIAIDIHRGRDHGLPPYVYLVNYCNPNNRNITRFDDLIEFMPQENIEMLKQNYLSVYDVDLYVGMQMEEVMEGSLLPPTAACVVGGQLYVTKYGDRFYFEHADQPTSFTLAQRESLKKSTVARLICDNTDIRALQKYPFLFASELNPVLRCRDHPEVDLNLWASSE